MTFRSVVRSYQCDLALSFARLRIIVEYVAERLGYLWSIALVVRLSSSRICSHFRVALELRRFAQRWGFQALAMGGVVYDFR